VKYILLPKFHSVPATWDSERKFSRNGMACSAELVV